MWEQEKDGEKESRRSWEVPGSLKGKSFNNPLIRTNFPNTIVIFVLATAQPSHWEPSFLHGNFIWIRTNHAQTADSVKYLFNFLKLFLMFLIMGICTWMKVPSEGRGIMTPCDWSYMWLWDTWHGCWKSVLGPLEKQQVLLTTELSLCPSLGIFFKAYWYTSVFPALRWRQED